MNITIVISAHNEEKYISGLLSKLEQYSMPTIVVNDGSKDKTSQIVKRYKKVSLISHKINLGKGAAMKTGAQAAFKLGADAVIFLDADGQHSTTDLPKFVLKLEENKYDIVFGIRKLNNKSPMVRSWGNKFGAVVVNILFGIKIDDILCGFRGLTKKGYELINWKSVGYEVETEMVVKTAINRLNYCTVPVKTIYHDKVKGVTIIDGFVLFLNVFRWKINI